MNLNKPIEQILFEKGKIDEKQFNQVKSAKARTGEGAETLLMKQKLATEEDIAEAVSEEIGVPFIDLKNFIIDPAVLSVFDEKAARRLEVLPLYVIRDTLTVAMSDPQNVIARDELKLVSDYKSVQVVMSTRSAILEGIDQNYRLGNTLSDIVRPLEQRGIVYAPADGVTPHMLATLAGEPPVVKFVNQMIFDAMKERASDIHIEPLQDTVRVRFRVDGVLHTAVSVSKSIHLPIAPRLKILAGVDIAESRKPQDGRFTVSVAGRDIDLRVAFFPMAHGENVTLRLLDKATAIMDVEELGFTKDMANKFRKLIRSPHGIILVTGPTGSGKISTLYAVLNKISSPEKNILTIEDPIEYLIDNVNQAQVNLKIGLDFAGALRSFLRQDPDAIMVGEIRDNETADIAFRAALTGHLVLSTLHTNDAPTAITRLKDLEVDRSLMSSSMIGVLAQRLVRIICSECKEEYQPDKTLFEDYGIKIGPGTKFYRGKGCEECSSTGYRGRIGVFELLVFTEKLRLLIQKDAPLEEIRQLAVEEGMRTLFEDGVDKVKQGITTIEEVVRVTQD